MGLTALANCRRPFTNAAACDTVMGPAPDISPCVRAHAAGDTAPKSMWYSFAAISAA